MGDAVQTIGGTEHLHPLLFAVGDNAKPNPRLFHDRNPIFHVLRRDIGRIRDDGVVKVQHQQFDSLLAQLCRGDIRQRAGDALWQQRNRHTDLHGFIG